MIIEVFGRYAGHTAFRGGVAADAVCILIPEIPVDFDAVEAKLIPLREKSFAYLKSALKECSGEP